MTRGNTIDPKKLFLRLLALMLRVALVAGMIGGGWFAYSRLPREPAASSGSPKQTDVDVILRLPGGVQTERLDIPVEFSPVDIVAVRHEFNSEPRSGKRFDDFLKERKNGRSSIEVTLDKNGRASAVVPVGDWWVHAVLAGDEAMEWRLHVTVVGHEQTIELNSENVYTRSRSF